MFCYAAAVAVNACCMTTNDSNTTATALQHLIRAIFGSSEDSCIFSWLWQAPLGCAPVDPNCITTTYKQHQHCSNNLQTQKTKKKLY